MQSLWNDKIAATHAHDPLALRVYSSRLLGGDPALVLHGGGNTSVKAIATDIFGDPVETLYVKGSGWDLGTIEKAGFAPVRLAVARRLADFATLSDGDMVKTLRSALLDPSAPTPSVETILHAIIPFTFVDHSHADAVVTVMNTPDGTMRIRDLYGPRLLIVPYVMPGFILARTVYQMTQGIDWQQLEGILLMNHGVFTFANDAQSSYEQHLAIVTQAEEYLQKQAKLFLPAIVPQPPKLTALAQLRQAVSKARGEAVIARLNTNDVALRFANLPNLTTIATRGLLTPDHVLRTRRVPVVLGEEVVAAVQAYVTAYDAYFERNLATYQQTFGNKPLKKLEPAPRWAVWPGYGTIAFAPSVKEAAIINDINEHTMAAIPQAEALGGWRTLGEFEIFEVEYWELEQAKATRQNKGGPALQGKIALVTGAASGIGKACVEALVAQGACVAALDIHPSIQTLFTSASVLGQICDVTDPSQLVAAVEATVQAFGGLDILVCNAGMFPKSQTIAEMDSQAWARSLDLNLTSHQQLLQAAIPYLKLGLDPAVVIIASKNVPAPGPGAGAYSVAKAGLTQLARVAALELGQFGIRVNVLHPNQVFDTGIWTPEVLESRARSYGLSVEAYKRNNLLQTEITSKDVAAVACALVGPVFAKTTGAQLPIDGGNERVI
ncbi:MAG: bifunctional aldolase/short-chain dehydrogenase [Caldilineaceae bacterium]|nr:bifunctional aldolase/short-chain dehydrogenase [Caldilineaceae bacterium]